MPVDNSFKFYALEGVQDCMMKTASELGLNQRNACNFQTLCNSEVVSFANALSVEQLSVNLAMHGYANDDQLAIDLNVCKSISNALHGFDTYSREFIKPKVGDEYYARNTASQMKGAANCALRLILLKHLSNEIDIKIVSLFRTMPITKLHSFAANYNIIKV